MTRALAPAKINLTLEVLARRSDGYHGVRSVMVPLGFGDELEYEPAPRFAFSCDRADLAGDDNLVVRAARALGDPPVSMRLHKRVPTQAGLGGGSSDAATVLLLAAAGEFGPVAPFDTLAVARSLGSDVPFFLCETAALVEGTGERVTPLGTVPPWWVVIVAPPAAVSTARAYARIDELERELRPRNVSRSLAAGEALQRADFTTVEDLLYNDFQAVACDEAPPIARALNALRDAGSRNPLLAGSGACTFALAPDRGRAEELAAALRLGDDFARIVAPFRSTGRWRG